MSQVHFHRNLRTGIQQRSERWMDLSLDYFLLLLWMTRLWERKRPEERYGTMIINWLQAAQATGYLIGQNEGFSPKKAVPLNHEDFNDTLI